jgi:hypothetical protein
LGAFEEFGVLHARHLAHDHRAGVVAHFDLEVPCDAEKLESVLELVVDQEGRDDVVKRLGRRSQIILGLRTDHK